MLKGKFLQILWIACTTLAQSSRLASRKVTSAQTYDPYMICDHDGPTHSEGLPAAYDEEIYIELLSLCSTAHGAFENLGCFCASAGRQVHCDYRLADRLLWNAHYTPQDSETIRRFEGIGFPNGHMTFKQFCENGCECETTTNADIWFQDRFDGEDWSDIIGAEGILNETHKLSHSPKHASGGNTFAEGSLIGSGKSLHDQHAWQNQCGNNCTSSRDCTVPVGGDTNGTCACQAHSSQYQPGSGTVAFLAACLVTLGSSSSSSIGGGGGWGGKKKRADEKEERLPCPCNASYVSHGCCNAPNGYVWEPLEMKLGHLLVTGATEL